MGVLITGPNKMEEDDLEMWCKKIQKKLSNKSVLLLAKGCRQWTGSTKARKGRGATYGRMNVRIPGSNSRIRMSVHRLAYIVQTKNLTLSREYDVSHVCHNSLCVNFEHLSLEPCSINNCRKACKKGRLCMGHGSYPHCML